MSTKRNIFLILTGFAMVLMLGTYMSRCSRVQPVTKHTDNRLVIMDAHSAKSRSDSLHREELASLKSAYQDTIRRAKANYKVIVQKDVRIEYRYRQAPSLVTCDSVIDSKNLRIGALETINQQYQFADLMNDSLITSYQGSIRAKDKTIGQLNAGYEQAITDLQKAKRPRRWGIGVMAGYGVGQSLRPGPVIGVGLSYNLIRL